MTRDEAGRQVCAVVGCQEPVVPWGSVYDFDQLEVELFLCRRHERELNGTVADLRDQSAGAPAE